MLRDYSNERTKTGELMDKYTPLQKIDYATRRADDDLKASEKLGHAAKVCAMLAICTLGWVVIIELVFL